MLFIIDCVLCVNEIFLFIFLYAHFLLFQFHNEQMVMKKNKCGKLTNLAGQKWEMIFFSLSQIYTIEWLKSNVSNDLPKLCKVFFIIFFLIYPNGCFAYFILVFNRNNIFSYLFKKKRKFSGSKKDRFQISSNEQYFFIQKIYKV